jgi:hypothetical protein
MNDYDEHISIDDDMAWGRWIDDTTTAVQQLLKGYG